ncbi:heavy metal translocating P-type ATPase [Intestinibacter bartlettii]|uniref:Cd(2+)-exporting ATPase n=1 Tax=Intestinibacter bartlettii TaxID=261299 RepID=A0ABS6E0Z5_9FIRM|nr:cation-translocating P-type ATPase [Intestinibacter bartlettii]MBU5337156.1 cation-translocating P-type ATPase [Intestinibacter bartlettii]
MSDFIRKNKIYILPFILAVLNILAIIFHFFIDIPFKFEIIPLVIGGFIVIKSTVLATIKKRKVTAGLLVVLALIGTTYVGEYLSGSIVSFMMIFGEFLEDLTMKKTQNAVRSLIQLVPHKCRKKIGNKFEQVSIREVRPGDIIQVIAGEKIPVDGIIQNGQATINEAAITGESMPVDKTIKDKVFVGTLNENGVIEILTQKIGNETILGQIIKTVKSAQENKGNVQKTADKFAEFFLPTILLICAITALLTKDIMRVMSILVIACPCALVLATPTAVVASVGNAAKKGVLIKGGVVIEELAKVTTICFDKTGTITNGTPEVVDLLICDDSKRNEFFNTLAIVEKNSGHPIGKSIIKYLVDKENLDLDNIPNGEFNMLFGRGVNVKLEDKIYEVSNRKIFTDLNNNTNSLSTTENSYHKQICDFLDHEEKLGRTALLVVSDGNILGCISIADTVRPYIKDTLQELKTLGIEDFIMLTGDNEYTAKAICDEVGINQFKSNLLPQEKLDYIKELQSNGKHVAMIGDGINDAPALTLANVGIAMGMTGTDIASDASDITLMSDRIDFLCETIALSKKTYSIIKQNIWVFAVCVNIIGILLSGLGFLNPIAAAIIHNASSIFVVLNSSRMLGYKYKNDTTNNNRLSLQSN